MPPGVLGCGKPLKPGGGMIDILLLFGSYGSALMPQRDWLIGVARPDALRPSEGLPGTLVPVPCACECDCGNMVDVLPMYELASGFNGAGGGMSGALMGEREPARDIPVDPLAARRTKRERMRWVSVSTRSAKRFPTCTSSTIDVRRASTAPDKRARETATSSSVAPRAKVLSSMMATLTIRKKVRTGA